MHTCIVHLPNKAMLVTLTLATSFLSLWRFSVAGGSIGGAAETHPTIVDPLHPQHHLICTLPLFQPVTRIREYILLPTCWNTALSNLCYLSKNKHTDWDIRNHAVLQTVGLLTPPLSHPPHLLGPPYPRLWSWQHRIYGQDRGPELATWRHRRYSAHFVDLLADGKEVQQDGC